MHFNCSHLRQMFFDLCINCPIVAEQIVPKLVRCKTRHIDYLAVSVGWESGRSVALGLSRGCSHLGAWLGRTHFLAHSHGCWQGPALCRPVSYELLASGLPQLLAIQPLPRASHSMSRDFIKAREWEDKKEGQEEQEGQQDGRQFLMTWPQRWQSITCHILFITSESLDPPHIQEEGTAQNVNTKSRVWGDHFKSLVTRISCPFLSLCS